MCWKVLAPVGRLRPLETPGPALAAADAPPVVGLVRQLPRFEAVSRAVTPAHRHDGSPWPGVPVAELAAPKPQSWSSSANPVAGLPTTTARHYPLFPTGPPHLT